MAIELGLRQLLLSQMTLTGLAPPRTVDGTRYDAVFCEHSPQGFDPPFILISIIDHDPLKHLGGTTGLAFTEIDVDCYAVSYPAARVLADAVTTFLKDYTGPAGVDDVIKAVLWDAQRYDVLPEAQGRDVRQHIISSTFTIHHQPRGG